MVSGADYVNAIWKDTRKVMMSQDALNLALNKMFALPDQDMPLFWSDKTGSSSDPHTQSPPRDADQRVHYLMLKTTAEYLSRENLAATAQRFQTAMKNQLADVPVQGEWVEMADLFDFTRRLVAKATCESILGTNFLNQFPDFVDSFYVFNSKIMRMLQGWPRFLMPKAWQARKRCLEVMQQWRKTVNVHDFDGNPLMPKRWSYFEKWNVSDEAIASQDMGILFGCVGTQQL